MITGKKVLQKGPETGKKKVWLSVGLNPQLRWLTTVCRVGQYYNKSRISPNKYLMHFAILSQRQYLLHCAILIAPNNNVACYCILSRLYAW